MRFQNCLKYVSKIFFKNIRTINELFCYYFQKYHKYRTFILQDVSIERSFPGSVFWFSMESWPGWYAIPLTCAYCAHALTDWANWLMAKCAWYSHDPQYQVTMKSRIHCRVDCSHQAWITPAANLPYSL